MYRPVMLMASDHQSTTQDSTLFGSQGSRKPEPEPATTKTTTTGKGRSRKSSAKPKRPLPQRGVGVAQLERQLRIQRGQGLTKLAQVPLPQAQPQLQTQVVQNVVLPDHQQRQFQYYQNSETRSDPLRSIPVLYGASNYDGVMSGGSGLVGLDWNGLLVNGNGGSAGFGHGYNVRLHNEGGSLVMDQNQYGGVGVGASSHRGAAYEISNELSSVPKMKQQHSSSSSSEYCCCCKQKKRFNCGNNMGFGESPAVFPIVNSSDLPGFNSQNIPNVRLAGETGGGFSGGTSLGHHSSLVDETVEVRAVHRKGKQAGGDIMMEYEFFPDHNNNNNSGSVVSTGTYPMEHELVASSTNSSSVGRSSEASDQHVGTAWNEGADMMMMMSSGYSPVDLSLKLSF